MEDILDRVGSWEILDNNIQRKSGHSYVNCRCICGTERLVRLDHLRGNHTNSCGCQQVRPAADAEYRRDVLGHVERTCLVLLTTKLPKNSSTGVKGVCYIPEKDQYRAHIAFQRKKRHLGYYNTLEEAAEARRLAEEEIFKPMLDKYRN